MIDECIGQNKVDTNIRLVINHKNSTILCLLSQCFKALKLLLFKLYCLKRQKVLLFGVNEKVLSQLYWLRTLLEIIEGYLIVH